MKSDAQHMTRTWNETKAQIDAEEVARARMDAQAQREREHAQYEAWRAQQAS
jgi:hypothetical protein